MLTTMLFTRTPWRGTLGTKYFQFVFVQEIQISANNSSRTLLPETWLIIYFRIQKPNKNSWRRIFTQINLFLSILYAVCTLLLMYLEVDCELLISFFNSNYSRFLPPFPMVHLASSLALISKRFECLCSDYVIFPIRWNLTALVCPSQSFTTVRHSGNSKTSTPTNIKPQNLSTPLLFHF